MTTDLAVVRQLLNTPDLPEPGRGRCRRTPGRQGREHPPGLRLRLAAVPDVGRGRWPPRTARCPAGRGPLPGPPGLNRPVHRHRPAGPLGHLPLSRRRRDAEGRQSRPPPGGVRGGQGVAQPSPGSQAGALTADALARVREVLRLPQRGRGPTMLTQPPPVFGLTGETLANRVRAPARAGATGSPRLQRPHRDGADGGGGSAQRSGAAPGPVDERQYGGPLHPGRGGQGGPQVVQLKRGGTKTFHTGRQGNRRCRNRW